MSAIFDCFYKLVLSSFSSSSFYSFSLALFVFMLTLGCVSIVILHCDKNALKRPLKWLYYCYQIGYLLDICIAMCEYDIFGLYYKSIALAFLSCTARFVFLLLVYLFICCYNKVLLGTKKQFKNNELSLLNKAFVLEKKVNVVKKTDFLNKIDENCSNNAFKNSEIETIDINVPFINKLAEMLLAKDLTDDERDLCLDIIFELRNLPTTNEIDRIKSLNSKLQTLTKKAVLYNVMC